MHLKRPLNFLLQLHMLLLITLAFDGYSNHAQAASLCRPNANTSGTTDAP